MGSITLFEKSNYQGRSVVIAEGNVRFINGGNFNDVAMSVRLDPGTGAILYEHANEFGGYGRSIDLTKDCDDLGRYGFGSVTSFVSVFKTDRETHVWVSGRLKEGSYVPGHWERKRARGGTPEQAEPVVSPEIAEPTSPPSSSGGPVIRDHRGEEPSLPPPDIGNPHDATIRDHRDTALKHVFVLVLENRSFDHMLGFSGITGTDARTGQPTEIYGLTGSESNTFNGATYTVERGAPDRSASDPGHNFASVLEQMCGAGAEYVRGQPYPTINNSGYASEYGRSKPQDAGEAMRCFTPDQLPVMTALAKEFVVCDRWFSSMPGPTEPNRWFIHAATADEYDNGPTTREYVENMGTPGGGFTLGDGNIFQYLERKNFKYRIYACDDTPNVALLEDVSVLWDIDDFEDFAGDVASRDYDAQYTFIEPSYDPFREFKGGNSQHPLGSAKAGELLIKQTYEAIRRSPLWENSMLIVTYDEHGGFYDHVVPPAAKATGWVGRGYGFSFDQLGPRVPTLVISPLIPKNLIEHGRYEHSSIIVTLNELFDLDGPRTSRTISSSGLKHLVRLSEARTDTPLSLPDPTGGSAMRTAMKQEIGDVVIAEHPAAPVDADPNGNIAATLASGMSQHLEITSPTEHEAIRQRVINIKTQQEALEYLKEVAELVKLARARAGITRSSSVRRKLTFEV